MTTSALPNEVRDFICYRIHSIEQLEVVLRLCDDRSSRWSAGDLADALGITEALTATALQQLHDVGLLTVEGESCRLFHYAPATAELAQTVELLTVFYPRARVEILMLISRCAMERIRTAQVRAFAEAFLLRGPKPNR